MKPSRLTMLGLMGVIAVVGLFLAALLHPTPLVASIAWTGVLTILIVAALVAVLDPRRTFWVGFAVVGLIFAGFAAHPIHLADDEAPLLTSHILFYVFLKIFSGTSPRRIADVTVYVGPGSIDAIRMIVDPKTFVAFHRTGQALAALVHATAGGLLAVVLKTRLSREDQQKSDL